VKSCFLQERYDFKVMRVLIGHFSRWHHFHCKYIQNYSFCSFYDCFSKTRLELQNINTKGKADFRNCSKMPIMLIRPWMGSLISIQHRSRLLCSTCWTSLATSINDVYFSFLLFLGVNNVRFIWPPSVRFSKAPKVFGPITGTISHSVSWVQRSF